MSYKHSPRFVLVSQYKLPEFSGAPSVTRIGSFGTTATVQYRVLASYDGAGRLHNIQSAASAILGVGAGHSTVVSWSAINRALWFRLYKAVSPGGFFLVYSGPATTYRDDEPELQKSAEPISNVGSPASNSTNSTVVDPTSGVDLTVDFKPSAAEWCFVRSVEYEDQSTVEVQAVDRTLVAKEFGVRPRVTLGFVVEPGSQEERDIVAIYGAKLAFPDVVVKFSLYGDGDFAGGPRPVRIGGNIRRFPVAGVNERISFEWEILGVDLLPVVPDMGGAANVQIGRGVW